MSKPETVSPQPEPQPEPAARVESRADPERQPEPTGGRRPRSLFLRVLGLLFIALGIWWAIAFATVVQEGSLNTFIGARTGFYALTYLLGGIGMFLHARWAALAVGAWAVTAFSQLFYPPIPRENVPLFAQVALALICLLWMLGLVFYVYRRTRAPSRNA